MDHNLVVADYTVIAGFFIVMIGIGLYFSRRMRNLQDYFSGGRRIPWWLSGASLYMSSFSAFTFVAYSEMAYKYGFVSITIWWGVVVCVILSAWFFAARWRRAVTTSPLEYIETRFGPGLRQGLAWLGIPLIVIDDGLKLFAIGKLVSVSLGFSLGWAIFLSGTLMLTYTFLGGLWAVIITDFVQFAVMAAAICVLVPLSLSKVGGISGFFANLPADFQSPTQGDYNPWYLFSFCLIMFFAYSTKWPLVQRYYSVGTDREAFRVGWLVAFLTLVGAPVLFLPAMAAAIYMPGLEDTLNVYGLICKELLPVGMVGMMIAAMFSATMSMLSSDYNAAASVITNDIYKRFVNNQAQDRHLVLVGRLSTLAVGVLSLGIGFLIASRSGQEDLFKFMARLASVLLPPVAIPMLAGLCSRRASNAGGLGGFLAGSILGIGAYFASYLPAPAWVADHNLLNDWVDPEGRFSVLRTVPFLTWITTIPTFLGVILFSAVLPDSPRKQKEVDRFLDGVSGRTSLPERPIPVDSAPFSPAPIIGASLGSLGLLTVAVVLLTAPLSEAFLTLGVGLVMVFAGFLCWIISPRSKAEESK